MTEAKYVALLECTIKFSIQILGSMEIAVQLLFTVYVDNIGAIFLANNQNTNDQMKHVDV